MKKLLLISLLLLVGLECGSAYGLIITENVHKDDFRYEVGYHFSTGDLQASQSDVDIPINPKHGVSPTAGQNFYYVVPRDGAVVGMSISGNAACIAGSATFDVTINNQVTGVQTVIEPTVGSSAREPVGTDGSADPQYAYIRQDRADDRPRRGFRRETYTGDLHTTGDYQFGKATALSAGNRVGVEVTTSSGFSRIDTDYVITVYVLH